MRVVLGDIDSLAVFKLGDDCFHVAGRGFPGVPLAQPHFHTIVETAFALGKCVLGHSNLPFEANRVGPVENALYRLQACRLLAVINDGGFCCGRSVDTPVSEFNVIRVRVLISEREHFSEMSADRAFTHTDPLTANPRNNAYGEFREFLQEASRKYHVRRQDRTFHAARKRL